VVNSIIVGFILAIILMPSMGCIVDNFKTKLIYESQKQKMDKQEADL